MIAWLWRALGSVDTQLHPQSAKAVLINRVRCDYNGYRTPLDARKVQYYEMSCQQIARFQIDRYFICAIPERDIPLPRVIPAHITDLPGSPEIMYCTEYNRYDQQSGDIGRHRNLQKACDCNKVDHRQEKP